MPAKETKLQFKRTALHAALICGHTDTVAVLLKLGADASMKDGGGMTSMDLSEGTAALNALNQVCSYDKLKRWDTQADRMKERKIL